MPELLGKYILEHQIGGGHLSSVFAARDPNGNLIALKRLNSPDPALVANFQREIDLLRRVSHPNIVPVLDANTEGEPFYTMPLLDGESLESLVRRNGPLALSEVCRLIGQLATALDTLHTLGIVHRDVTPANVIMLRDGRAVLVDFSLATIVGTKGQPRVGTPLYCAPEQWRGEVPTPSADIYTLGGVAYFALSGRAPYEEKETAERTAAQHAHGRLRPLHQVNHAVPRTVSAVVMRALSRDPRQRWGTAGEFARQFEAATRARPARRLSMSPALITSAVLALSLAMLAVGIWGATVPQPPSLRPIARPTVTSQSPLAAFTAGLAPTSSALQQQMRVSNRTVRLKPSVTPLPELLETRAPQPEQGAQMLDVEPTLTPRPTRTPPARINLELSGVSGQERWGTPMNPDGCSPPFDDRRPVWRYKVTLTIRHTGTTPLSDWSVKLFNQNVPLHTCLMHGSYDPIQPGETRQVEVVAFLSADPAVQARVISNRGTWRLCFQ
ncbi:MAG: protein kinase, partial [Thermoflexales bacterium]|nr:protein kinase [Thermoflexales bacterium]